MTVHSPEEHARHHRRYLQVFAWLAILTMLGLGAVKLHIHPYAIGLCLVVLAATKAALVALYYMHLSVEKRTLAYVALTPAILCVLLLFALMPDLRGMTRGLFHEKPAASASAP